MDEKLLGKLCFMFSAMLGCIELNCPDEYVMFKSLIGDKELDEIHKHKDYDCLFDMMVGVKHEGNE